MGRGIFKLTPEQEGEVEHLWAQDFYSATETARILECSVNTVLRTIKRREFKRPKDRKRCPRCTVIKVLCEFPKHGGRCFECNNEIRIAKEYGLSTEFYRELLSRQNGQCGICTKPAVLKRHAVDHCHSSGRVRGLLCFSCNIGLGHFHHDPELLKRAIAYL